MTKEEKRLLLKDLCARLPYGVKIHIQYTFKPSYNVHIEDDTNLVEFNLVKGEYRVLTSRQNTTIKRFPLENIKPYLRPMSSMTEEELKEFRACHCVYDLHPDFQPMMCNIENEQNMFDWLNKHHFDYRGLIKKGLALEAKEGMYKTE